MNTDRAGSRQPDGGQPDVLIVGGGVIGLGVGWRLSQAGVRVAVYEADSVVGAASHAAAAMIAPVGYVEPLDDPFLRLRVDGAAAWPGFAAELQEAAGQDVRYRQIGSLIGATTAAEQERIHTLRAFHRELGIATETLSAQGVREVESRIADDVDSGLYFPEDGCVCPAALGPALVRAIRADGGEVHERTPVRRLLTDAQRVRGVETDEGTRHSGAVLVAAGTWSGRIAGLPEEALPPVHPVKGQSIYVRSEDPAYLQTVLRSGANIVPRGDGRILLAGTVEPEAGDDVRPTAGGLLEVLAKAQAVLPSITELEAVTHTAGLRPVAADDAPVLGPGALDGLWWATGHSYYGVLLTPITAELIAGALTGDATASERVRLFDVHRFGGGDGGGGTDSAGGARGVDQAGDACGAGSGWPRYTSLHRSAAHR